MPWWIQSVGESLAEAAPPIKFVATLLSKLGEIRDPDRLAYLAFTTAYQRAIEKALKVVGAPVTPSHAGLAWKPKTDIPTPAEGMTFGEYSLKDPFNHPFLNKADELLDDAMDAAGYDEARRRMIQNEVKMRFPGSLKSLLTHPKTYERFTPLAGAMHFGNTEDRVHTAWKDHFEYQRFLYEDQLVFGEEPFSLSDIYVETECGSLTFEELWKDGAGNETLCGNDGAPRSRGGKNIDPFLEKNGGRQPLIKTVMDLIGDKDFRDAIVVQGPAGSGKSAFTHRLCTELLRAGLKPIRIRFRDIPLKVTNIEDALPEAVQFCDPDARSSELPHARPNELFLGMSLFEPSVPFKDAQICPWVLILDGWDEVSIAAEKGFAVRVGEILTQIRDRFISNRRNATPVRVILTGRPSSAVTDSSNSFLKRETRLLTIRPLTPEQLQCFIPRLAERLDGSQRKERADATRFKAIISKYEKEFEEARKAESDGRMSQGGAMEVLGLPLLTHLAVRLMVNLPDTDLQPIVENPTMLYRLLTNITCVKGGRYGKSVYDPMWRHKDLRLLLHDAAAAMTVFGRDNIPYEELDLRLSQLNEELLDRVHKATQEHPVTSLMISFFFKGGRTELGAEFLHKSFREYLFAEAVVEALKEYGRREGTEFLPERDHANYWKDFEPTDPRYDFSRKLGHLLAPQWCSQEVVQFIEGLIRWELARAHGQDNEPKAGEGTEMLDIAGWRRVRDGLADLWGWWGEGVHLRQQPIMQGKKIKEWARAYVEELVRWAMPQEEKKGEVPVSPRTTSMDGHLGDGLFRLACLVHHYVAIAPGESSTWDDMEKNSWKHFLYRRYQMNGIRNGKSHVRFRPTGLNREFFMNYASRINAVGWHPLGCFPHRTFLGCIDFSHTAIDQMLIAHCDLNGADLQYAGMHYTYLSMSNLTNADLRNAIAQGACLDHCLMEKTKCDNMEGIDATFEWAIIKDAIGFDNIKGIKRKYKERLMKELRDNITSKETISSNVNSQITNSQL